MRPANRILHVDGDSFFASCEIALNPKLQERPVWVGGGRKGDGIVIAANRISARDGQRKPSSVYLAVIVAVVKVMFPAPPPPTSTRILASSIFPSVRPKLAHSL